MLQVIQKLRNVEKSKSCILYSAHHSNNIPQYADVEIPHTNQLSGYSNSRFYYYKNKFIRTKAYILVEK